jgi:putative MATE family efflux protein
LNTAQSENTKFEMMTTRPVEKLVCEMAVPTVIIMLVSAMYNTADTYFVGSPGTSATAAVGISFSLMSIIQALGFFFGHGAGNYISRALGARNTGNAGKMAATGFFSAFIAGGVIALAGTVLITPLARLLGATDTILPYARSYLRFILPGAPFMVASLMLNNTLRFQGSAVWGMIGMISGAALNIGLDPLFIYGIGMGVAGASLATMLSQMVSCALLVIVSGIPSAKNVRIVPRNFAPGLGLYKEMIRGGVPSLLRQSLQSLAVIFLNRTAGGYGDAVIAAAAIVGRLVIIAGAALLGLGQGFQPVCGFIYGAKQYNRVKRAVWCTTKLTTALLTVVAALSFIFAAPIIALFRRDDPVVIAEGTRFLRLQCGTLPLMGWIVLVNMTLQTIGKAVPASILAVARQGIFLIPLLCVLPARLGIFGIQLCAPVSDLLTFMLAIPLGLRTLRAMREEPDSPARQSACTKIQ